MRYFLLSIFIVCSIYTTLIAQIQVAVLEPIAITNNIHSIEKSMIGGEITKAIASQKGYAAFSRGTDINQILEEQSFQQSGMVDDVTRKRLGALQGVDYVCITKITKEENAFYIEANLVDVETGQISHPSTQYGVMKYSSDYEVLYAMCQNLAAELVGRNTDTGKHVHANSSIAMQTSMVQNQSSSLSSTAKWVHYDYEYIVNYLIEKNYKNIEVNEQVLQQITGKIQTILQQVGRELKVKYIFDKKHLLYVDDNAVDVTDIIKDRL